MCRLPRLCSAKPSGTRRQWFAADSCGGSSGLIPNRETHRIPLLGRSRDRPPERDHLKIATPSLSIRPIPVAADCSFSVTLVAANGAASLPSHPQRHVTAEREQPASGCRVNSPARAARCAMCIPAYPPASGASGRRARGAAQVERPAPPAGPGGCRCRVPPTGSKRPGVHGRKDAVVRVWRTSLTSMTASRVGR